MTLEEKVGLTAFLLLLLLVSAFFVTRDFSLKRNRFFYEVVFEGPVYLRSGDPVEVLGVPYGKISNIYIENGKVVAKFYLQKYRIPEDSKIVLESAGLLGQYRLMVLPGKGSIAKNGIRFQGARGETIDEAVKKLFYLSDTLMGFISRMDVAMQKTEKYAERLQGSLEQLSISLKVLTDTTSKLISQTQEEALRLLPQIQSTLIGLDSLLLVLRKSGLLENDSLFVRVELLTRELTDLTRMLKDKGIPVKLRIF
ncbi:MAG: MlaD family protein [Candidatus Hydrothermia bacterium]